MKLDILISEWENSISKAVKTRTKQCYESVVRNHILPKLGNSEIAGIDTVLLQGWVNELSEKLSANSVSLVVYVLKSILTYAVEREYIKSNPCIGVKKIKSKPSQVGAFTYYEQQKIERIACQNRKYFGVILALYTGLRIGELLALKWTDFDPKESLLSVKHTAFVIKLENGKWEQIASTPKTSSSIRSIPVSSKLKRLIIEHKKTSKSEFIIDCKGKQMNVRNYQGIFKNMLKKAEVRQLGFHSLRHTFATRAVEMGIDIKTLSELLGHSNPTITISRYVHSNMEQKRKAVNKISQNMK